MTLRRARAERVAGGLWGLLVGDAVGVPYEFHPPAALPGESDLEPEPPPGFSRAHPGVPVGTWSDDGAQALCLLESLLERGWLDPKDLAARMVRWMRHGHMTADGVVFDIGMGTSAALSRVSGGVDARRAGGVDERSNGNGSLMRVLPLVLWHRDTDASLVADAHLQSRVTHGHPRSQVCCALYCLWARRLLDDHPTPWEDAVESLRGLYEPGVFAVELEQVLAWGGHNGTGYVVDALHSARWALARTSYEGVVKAAVGLGHDTDTTACIAGGLAGLRDGHSGIPPRWLAVLRGQEIVQPLLERLLEHLDTLP